MARDEEAREISWMRASLTSLVIVVVAVALLIVVPNIIITRWNRFVHSARVAFAVAWFFISTLGLAGALRALQSRRIL